MVVTLLLAAASLVVRYRRADLTARRQLKWIALAGLLLPIAIISASLDPTGDSSGPMTYVPFILLLVAVPVSIGVAVLRYRLYDVDQVVATTVVYVTLTVLLGAAFVAVIVVGGVLIGGGSPITTAVATLAVALAFRPVRSAVQGRVERSFNPRRWSGEQQVDTFLVDLRAGRREPEAVGEMLGRGGRRRDLACLLLAARAGRTRGRSTGPSSPSCRPSRRGARPSAAATCRSARSCTPTGPPYAASSSTCSSGPGWPSRSPGCGWRCSGSSPRSSARGPGSSAPRWTSDAGSSETSTTVPSSSWSPSVWTCGTCRPALDADVAGSRPARRLRTPARRRDPRAARARPRRPALHPGRRPGAGAGRAGRPHAGAHGARRDRRAVRGRGRGGGVLRGQRSPRQRPQARDAGLDRGARGPGRRAPRGHGGRRRLRGAAAVPGRGLAGMADRVEALGGSLHVDDGPRGGTRVRAELPCA